MRKGAPACARSAEDAGAEGGSGKGHSSVTLGIYWAYLRVTLGICWGYSRVILGIYWAYLRVILGIYWAYLRLY